MNKASLCLFGGALLGAGLSNPALGDIQYSGQIDVIQSHYSGYGSYDYVGLGSDYGSGYGYNHGVIEIHTFNFSVLSDSNVVIDALSWDVFDTFFDTQIMLFNNDGNILSNDNFIAENDDYGFGINLGLGDFNGSNSELDSFMNIFLGAGDYTIAIGGLQFDADDAAAGGGESRVLSNSSIPDFGEYQLDIIGDVAPTVPAPGALALIGLGGLVGSRRRR